MGVRWGFTGACISQNLTNSIKIGILHHIEVVLQKKNKRYTNIELLGRISSVGKESACNAGDLGLIPGLGRSPGEGIGYPLQYSWASLVAQLVKNLPAMWETWVRSLGWEDPLEKGTATHSSFLAWVVNSGTGLSNFDFHWVAFTFTFQGELYLKSIKKQDGQENVNCIIEIPPMFLYVWNFL